jgi:hypothetical protein
VTAAAQASTASHDHELHANATAAGVVAAGRYEHWQLCVARHPHAHRVTLRALPTSPTSGDVDLFISARVVHPVREHCDFISADAGGDAIAIPSDHPDWPSDSHVLYVGVRGSDDPDLGPVSYELTVELEVMRKGQPWRPAPRLRGARTLGDAADRK